MVSFRVDEDDLVRLDALARCIVACGTVTETLPRSW
jgi:hypothetical protein